MNNPHLDIFCEKIIQSLGSNEFVKLTLSNKRNKENDLKHITAKAVLIKNNQKLSFVYTYPTKDITKNFDVTEAISLIKEMLTNDFTNGDLFTTGGDFHLALKNERKSKLTSSKATCCEPPSLSHDKEKKRWISLTDNIYLRELGITNPDGSLKKDMQDKYRQINKYIEIIDALLKQTKLPDHFHIVDMGAGKGYLTFAVYDYLVNTLHLNPEITGVEFRPELVDKCNRIANTAGFGQLHFKAGTIETANLDAVDVLIALHACDTATDEAIYRGIHSAAKLIICAPCCHKQLRKQLHPSNDLNLILKHGILEERQAELLTDGIRAAILEAYGYQTKVFEFISTEHTPKNVMITAIKSKKDETRRQEIFEKIKYIKGLYHIEFHYLERLLGIESFL